MNFSGIIPDCFIRRLVVRILDLIPPNAKINILQGELKGYAWIVGSSIHSCWLGCYEDKQTKAMIKEVDKYIIIYDIGANVGFYTLLFSKL